MTPTPVIPGMPPQPTGEINVGNWLNANPVLVLALVLLLLALSLYKLVPSFAKVINALIDNSGIRRKDNLDTQPIPLQFQIVEGLTQSVNGLVAIIGPSMLEQRRTNDILERGLGQEDIRLRLQEATIKAQEIVNKDSSKGITGILNHLTTQSETLAFAIDEIKTIRQETEALKPIVTLTNGHGDAIREVDTGVKAMMTTTGELNEKIDKLEKEFAKFQEDVMPMLRDIQAQVATLVKRPGTGPLKADPLITPADPLVLPAEPKDKDMKEV